MSVGVGVIPPNVLFDFISSSPTYADIVGAFRELGLTIVEGIGALGTKQIRTGGAASAISSSTETALELAEGAALGATQEKIATSAVGLTKTANASKVAAVLGVDLGVAGAAIAPLLGVSLGVGLYELNPEFWTNVSSKLLPFCYPGTTTLPVWAQEVDGEWEVGIPKPAVDAVKDYFDSEGIGQTAGGWVDYEDVDLSPLIDPNFAYNFFLYQSVSWSGTYSQIGVVNVSISGAPVMCCQYYDQPTGNVYPNWHCYGTSPFSVTEVISGAASEVLTYNSSPYTHNGITYHYVRVPYASWWVPGDRFVNSTLNLGKGDARWDEAYLMFNGTGGAQEYYPEGTQKWEGTIPQTIPTTNPAVIGIDSTTGEAITEDLVPISIPYDTPISPQKVSTDSTIELPFPWPKPEEYEGEWPDTMPWPLPEAKPDWWPPVIPYPGNPPQYPSADPSIQPDPTVTDNPDTQVGPYTLPVPIPYGVTTPVNAGTINPALNPAIPMEAVEELFAIDPPIPYGPEIPPRGISPWSPLPTTDLPFSQNAGFVTVYHPTSSQLYSFEQWLWVTYADATIDKTFNNPFDGVISLFELYCTPTDIGTNTIKSGFLDSGINSAVISRYTELNCGTLGIPEFYGNYFDYSPYSKAHIYLPFIGVQELNVDDIVGHTVNVTYRIDEYNGSCIAMITVAKVTEVNGEDVEYSNTMYQFSGNCSVELPFAGGTQASIKSGFMTANAYQQASMVSAGASLLGGLGSLLLGSIGGAISGLGNAASSLGYGNANALSNMLSGKSTVQKSGQFGSSHGALGIKKPFITITRPKQIQVPNYNELYGYPAHKMVTVGNCTGFLRCREVNVVSATASDDEKSLIEQLLKTGVYVTE